MQNYRIILSYDGTDFCGWQRQPDVRTVQGAVEEALAKILRKKITVNGAGRTDAGVHALGQAASFKAHLTLPEKELLRAMNAVLPSDVNIISLGKAGPEFHARKSAKSKIYQYRIFNSRQVSPFLLRYVLYWPGHLDLSKMQEVARLFIREDDFSPFSSSRDLHPVRRVAKSEVRKKGKEIVYTIEANGFLRYMVRTIVGTLLEVGRGKMPPEQINEIFKKKDRSLAGPTAPPQGLCLLKVIY